MCVFLMHRLVKLGMSVNVMLLVDQSYNLLHTKLVIDIKLMDYSVRRMHSFALSILENKRHKYVRVNEI